jgi:hypothetical protein
MLVGKTYTLYGTNGASHTHLQQLSACSKQLAQPVQLELPLVLLLLLHLQQQQQQLDVWWAVVGQQHVRALLLMAAQQWWVLVQ